MRETSNEHSSYGEMRRDRRHPLPVLEVAIGMERFHSINWSMNGALLDGICEIVGARVRGVMGIAGSRDAVPFAATVVRTNLHSGSCALCFEDVRTEAVDFHTLAYQLH